MGYPVALPNAYFGEGVGPIFLDKLRCQPDDDATLLDCQSGLPRGLATCTHSQDVSVRCPGTYYT